VRQIIKEFQGEHRFLSNFHPGIIVFNGLSYATAEHLYQSLKAKTIKDRDFICDAYSPADAKSRGSQIKLRPCWEYMKDRMMRLVLLLKFTQHPDLANKLRATDGYELREGNMWGDKYWGVCLKTNEGQNRLGILLQEVRKFIL